MCADTDELERAAAQLRAEGWATVEVRAEPIRRSESARWILIPAIRRPPTASERKKIEVLSARVNQLREQLHRTRDEIPAHWARLQILTDELGALLETLQVWDAATRASCRAIAVRSRHGIQLIRGIANVEKVK
jgi:hypothetical protein